MDRSEMDTLLQAIKRVERKLDTVIRAIYEHDEDIQDEYGRSQRTIDAGLSREAEREAGDVLGSINESSLPECDVPGVPISKRRSEGEENSPTNNGEVPREEHVSSGNGRNKDVPRKDGVQQHATSKPNASGRHHSRGNRQRGVNESVRGSN
jgi:hypothetical protein